MKKSTFRWTIGLLLCLCTPCILHAQAPEYPPDPSLDSSFVAPPPPPVATDQLDPIPAEYTDGCGSCDVSSAGQCGAGWRIPSLRSNRGPSRLATWWIESAKPCLQYSHWSYPEYFEETPHGARLRQLQAVQICNGWASRLMLYHYDFCQGSSELNLHGQRRLQELATAFPVWMHHALVIESTPGDSQLDRERRDHIAALLADAGTPAQVEVGYSKAVSPFGDETKEVGDKFLRSVSGGGIGGGMGP